MSKPISGTHRRKTARDFYVDQFPYAQNKRRKSLTHGRAFDDSAIAYRGAPEYLRQLLNTSATSVESSTKKFTRTTSASESTSTVRTVIGNPKYKAQEDYYDEIHELKKELKAFKDENNNMRAKLRRLEEDNARKRREIDTLYDSTKDDDVRRTLAVPSTDRSSNNALMNLKQRLFKLELQLKQKETTIDEMKRDPRWTKGTELEILNRALLNEVERQKVDRLTYIQEYDYMASIDEEKKNAVRRLESEKAALKFENEYLKKKVNDLKDPKAFHEEDKPSSVRRDGSLDKDGREYRDELAEMKDQLKKFRRERDQFHDKFDYVNETLEEVRRERDQYRRKLDRAQQELDDLRNEPNRAHRASPGAKRDGERSRDSSYVQFKRPESNRESFMHKRRGSNSSDEGSKKDSRSSPTMRKSNEHLGSRLSPTKLGRDSPLNGSFRGSRVKQWTAEDDRRVKNFREKHAATVIQRGWRQHKKPHRNSGLKNSRYDQFDQRSSRTNGMKPSNSLSPRASLEKLGSKKDLLGSGALRNRPASANLSTDSALKTVQAVLRGYLNRANMNQVTGNDRLRRLESDLEHRPSSPASFHESERKRDSFLNQSKSNLGDRYSSKQPPAYGSDTRLATPTRDSTSKLHRAASPPANSYRTSGNNVGSRQNLTNDRNRLGSNNRLMDNDRELPSKSYHSSSPLIDNYRPGSARSKSSLINDRNKSDLDRDILVKSPRPSSPFDDQRSSRPSHLSSRNGLINPRASAREVPVHDDDDDILGF